MVLIKNATLLKTSVGFGEGETEDLDQLPRSKPEGSLKGAIQCSGEEERAFYSCTWQYLV